MAIAIETAYNQLSQNQLRTSNMYEVYVTTGYTDVDQVLHTMTIYAEGFTAPTRTEEFAEAGFKGYPIQVPTVLKMEQDHTINIRADVNGELRRAFLAWQAKTADPDIEGGSIFAGDRRVNINSIIRLYLLDNNMKDVAEVIKICGVRVQNVGGIQMSNQDASINTFEVSFKSQYWKIEYSAKGALVGQA